MGMTWQFRKVIDPSIDTCIEGCLRYRLSRALPDWPRFGLPQSRVPLQDVSYVLGTPRGVGRFGISFLPDLRVSELCNTQAHVLHFLSSYPIPYDEAFPTPMWEFQKMRDADIGPVQ